MCTCSSWYFPYLLPVPFPVLQAQSYHPSGHQHSSSPWWFQYVQHEWHQCLGEGEREREREREREWEREREIERESIHDVILEHNCHHTNSMFFHECNEVSFMEQRRGRGLPFTHLCNAIIMPHSQMSVYPKCMYTYLYGWWLECWAVLIMWYHLHQDEQTLHS